MYYKNVEEFIRNVTFQTAKMFGLIEQEKLANFYSIFERLVFEDILSDSEKLVCYNSTFKHGRNFCTKTVAASLIASGISKDGTIPAGCNYYVAPLETNKEVKEWARRKYSEYQKDVLDEGFVPRIKTFAQDCIKNNKVDVEKTLVALFVTDDKHLEYVNTPQDDELFQLTSNLLLSELETLEREGLEGRLCYNILEEMKEIRHYVFLTKGALIAMATIDYDLATGKKVSKERVESAQRMVAAAKAYDEDTMAQFDDSFNNLLIVNGKAKKLGGK